MQLQRHFRYSFTHILQQQNNKGSLYLHSWYSVHRLRIRLSRRHCLSLAVFTSSKQWFQSQLPFQNGGKSRHSNGCIFLPRQQNQWPPSSLTASILTSLGQTNAECFWLQTNIADWLPRCGLFAYGELRKSSEAENGADQCLKLLPEKRQIPWLTVDIVWLHIDKTLQQYVLHNVADPRWWAFHSCFGRCAQ